MRFIAPGCRNSVEFQGVCGRFKLAGQSTIWLCLKTSKELVVLTRPVESNQPSLGLLDHCLACRFVQQSLHGCASAAYLCTNPALRAQITVEKGELWLECRGLHSSNMLEVIPLCYSSMSIIRA